MQSVLISVAYGALGFVLTFVPCFFFLMSFSLPSRRPRAVVYGKKTDAFEDSTQSKYGTEDRSDLFVSGIDQRGW